MAVPYAVHLVGPFRNLVVIDVFLFISAYAPILVQTLTIQVNAGDRSAVPLGFDGVGLLGVEAA